LTIDRVHPTLDFVSLDDHDDEGGVSARWARGTQRGITRMTRNGVPPRHTAGPTDTGPITVVRQLPPLPPIAISRAKSRTMTGKAANIGVLLVECPYRAGVVAELADTLNRHGASLLDSGQHRDVTGGRFFQRIRFDLMAPDRTRDALEDGLREIAAEFQMTWRISYSDRVPRIAVFASKQEHCLYDLLIRHRTGELPCKIALIISNHPDTRAIAEHFNIAFHHLPVTPTTKPAQEAAAIELLEHAGVELIVLARYMQILSPEFVARYPSQIINVHHSFLPAFVGANPYRQAHDKGVKMIGATSHYVTEELDQGPIIEQTVVRCSHADSIDDLVRKGRDLEKQVLAAAVRWHLQDRILVHGKKTIVFE
jgi:formyltetrahydrofolate deformylase